MAALDRPTSRDVNVRNLLTVMFYLENCHVFLAVFTDNELSGCKELNTSIVFHVRTRVPFVRRGYLSLI